MASDPDRNPQPYEKVIVRSAKDLKPMVLGLNHLTSSVSLRDRLHLSGDQLAAFNRSLLSDDSAHESVVFSTCNRTEIYLVSSDPHRSRKAVEKLWGSLKQVSEDEIRNHSYFHVQTDALSHLFRVIGSLDSLVLGEMQILGQVKEAYALAVRAGTVGFYFNRIFQCGMRLGKRIRSETAIHEGAVSIGYAAVELAKKVLGDLDGKTAGIIGAGEMGELTAQHLRKSGVERFIFFNRSVGSAERLAAGFDGEICMLEAMGTKLPECDIVVSATGASDIVVHKADVQESMRHRQGRPLFLIDIAAPRDIDPQVAEVYNAFLFSIDDLKHVIQENVELRRGASNMAMAIIEEELAKIESWLDGLDVVSTLVDIRRKYEDMAGREVAKWSANQSPETRRQLEELARSLLNKFLHGPSIKLKELGENGEGPAASYYAARLFALSEKHEDE